MNNFLSVNFEVDELGKLLEKSKFSKLSQKSKKSSVSFKVD